MPMIAQVCHHPCCSQVEKKLWVSPFATAEHTATLSRAVTTHIVLSWKKLWGFAW